MEHISEENYFTSGLKKKKSWNTKTYLVPGWEDMIQSCQYFSEKYINCTQFQTESQ